MSSNRNKVASAIFDLTHDEEINLAEKKLGEIGATPETHPLLFSYARVNRSYALEVVIAFAALIHLGATLNENEVIFEHILARPFHADKLPEVFKCLSEIGLTPNAHPDVYAAVVYGSQCSHHLSKAFRVFKEYGIEIHTHTDFYHEVIQHYFNAYGVPDNFAALRAIGAMPDTHPNLFLSTIKNQHCGDLALLFQVLIDYGATLDDHAHYFEAIIQLKSLSTDDRLRAAFEKLDSLGGSITKHPAIYMAIIKGYHVDAVVNFELLNKIGATLDANPDLFEAAARFSYNNSYLSKAFETLNKHGANLHTHPELFLAAISEGFNTEKFKKSFETLKEHGASIDKHPGLFLDAIRKSNDLFSDFSGLSIELKKLKDAGISIDDHTKMIHTLLRAMHGNCHYSALDIKLKALEDAGARPDTYPDHYNKVIETFNYGSSLPAVYDTLKEYGITLQAHPGCYLSAIESKSSPPDHCRVVLDVLNKIGATLNAYPSLFEVAIRESWHAFKLREILQLLTNNGAKLETHADLYHEVFEYAKTSDKVLSAFEELSRLGITVEACPKLYLTTCNHSEKMKDLFGGIHSRLHEAGYRKSDHQVLFDTIVQVAGDSPNMEHQLLQLTDSACQLAYAHPALINSKDPEAQSKFSGMLCKKLKEIESPWDYLTHGPLNLSLATIAVHKILRQIVKTDIDSIEARHDKAAGFIIKLPGSKDIPLSLLLQYANLSQLMLDTEMVSFLGVKIDKMLGHPSWFKSDCKNEFIDTLCAIDYKLAFNIYFSQKYKNINRLFRGEQLTNEKKYCLFNYSSVEKANCTKNILACLLVGCLINDALSKLSTNIWSTEEASLMAKIAGWWHNPQIDKPEQWSQFNELGEFKNHADKFDELLLACRSSNIITDAELSKLRKDDLGYLTLCEMWVHDDNVADRREIVDADVIAQRTANPWSLSALTSVSIFNNGSAYFQKAGSTRSKFHHIPCRVVLNNDEGEILLPHGLQVISVVKGDNHLHSYIVNSPDLVNNHFWSEVALLHAYNHHLSKNYKDQLSSCKINNIDIVRPNHGLAHTYRVMTSLDVVINYFSAHANDESFKKFCQEITDVEREWLRIAAAFSTTGRESEMSAVENLARYDKYRAASESHFLAFSRDNDFDNQLGTESECTVMISLLAHVVRYMGNPAYEAATDTQSQKNSHNDPDVRQKRNNFHRLLTVAHKLDLPRCYTPDEFERSMLQCLALSTPSEEQKEDYHKMIRYVIQLNKAHGNALKFTITSDNHFTRDGSQDYQPRFAEASTSIKRVRELSAIVAIPKFSHGCQTMTFH